MCNNDFTLVNNHYVKQSHKNAIGITANTDAISRIVLGLSLIIVLVVLHE